MNSDGTPQTAHEALYAQEVARHLFALDETLGRHDENLARWHLLSRCVPYFLERMAEIQDAREACYQSVKHVLPREELREEDRDSDPYQAYYESNPNEMAFEDQYGIPVVQAHRLPRVRMLLDWLGEEAEALHAGYGDEIADSVRGSIRVLDLSANDGFMAARLSLAGYRCDCLDLHPGNVQLARERKAEYPLIGRVEQGALEDAGDLFLGDMPGYPGSVGYYDAVVCFETVEHVRDPRAALHVMKRLAKQDGRLYVSTPAGAVEQGNVPGWSVVEPKGHVRVYTEQSFRALLEQFGQVEELVEGEDRVLVAKVRPNG